VMRQHRLRQGSIHGNSPVCSCTLLGVNGEAGTSGGQSCASNCSCCGLTRATCKSLLLQLVMCRHVPAVYTCLDAVLTCNRTSLSSRWATVKQMCTSDLQCEGAQ